MKDIYILAKPEEVERVERLITPNFHSIANIKVISDINGIPAEHHEKLEVVMTEPNDSVESEFIKKVQDKFDENEYTQDLIEKVNESMQKHFKEIESSMRYYDIPTYDNGGSDYHKLSGFNNKEKNKTRRKIEHQALKYQNRHWKK